ncbi:hypothetical protein [Actinokineospora inagensis]|uniref:hypothetical protein n=1 Tax=Actinokineospora inagensis TaxID=103730 RepID=UPI0003F5B355|nr:hypothetical protein [Actinokineospora inagensis]
MTDPAPPTEPIHGTRDHDPANDVTAEIPRTPPAGDAEPARRSGFWRELSGSLALGLCALAVVVLGLQIVGWVRGLPGPGVGVLLGHLGAAVVAVLAQRFADRGRGPQTALAGLVVAIAVGVVIWFFWWA